MGWDGGSRVVAPLVYILVGMAADMVPECIQLEQELEMDYPAQGIGHQERQVPSANERTSQQGVGAPHHDKCIHYRQVHKFPASCSSSLRCLDSNTNHPPTHGQDGDERTALRASSAGDHHTRSHHHSCCSNRSYYSSCGHLGSKLRLVSVCQSPRAWGWVHGWWALRLGGQLGEWSVAW